MNPVEFWDALCVDHGGWNHVLLHEAGHAVVAAHLGFVFVNVTINIDPRDHQNDLESIEGGGVHFSSPAALGDIIRADHKRSLQFCLAGALAEKGGFDHCLDRSYEGDVKVWRSHSGLLDGQTSEIYENYLGEPFVDVEESTRFILTEHSVAIQAVAIELGESPNLSLSFADVLNIMK